MDAQDDRRPALGERRLEVGGPRPVRRPDLDQLRAGPPDDLRDPDAATDLDELAARDDDPAAPGQPDRERERGGVVVRDEGVLGAGQRDQVLLGLPEPARRDGRSARSISSSEVVGSPSSTASDRGSATAPTEVRVDDDAGRVDDPDGFVAGPCARVAR